MKTFRILSFHFMFFFISITANTIYSQIYTGGNVSFNFDNGYYADVSPIIGYQIGKFNAGVSPIIAYSKRENMNSEYSYGGRIFSEMSIVQGSFIHVEFESLNIESPGNQDEREWILGLPLGVGYEYEIIENVTAHAMVLYDVLLEEDSPRDNPVVRAGIRYNLIKTRKVISGF